MHASIYQGLRANNMLGQYTDVLFGYMASQPFFDAATDLVIQMKKDKPDLFFCTSQPSLAYLIPHHVFKLMQLFFMQTVFASRFFFS